MRGQPGPKGEGAFAPDETVRCTYEKRRMAGNTPKFTCVLGKDDEVSRLLEQTLVGSDYMPRILTHPRYAISTVKRIGAKAVIVNLELDPEFSARSVFDTLRADPATARLPIIICARQAWLQSTHRTYISDKRLRLLLVPFTPEELVMTLDKALDENS